MAMVNGASRILLRDWGTYTFEGGVLTYFNADDSECAGAVAVWEVVFSVDGNEAQETFVSDTCNSIRGRDRVLVRTHLDEPDS
jgi:hypothetical protein